MTTSASCRDAGLTRRALVAIAVGREAHAPECERAVVCHGPIFAVWRRHGKLVLARRNMIRRSTRRRYVSTTQAR